MSRNLERVSSSSTSSSGGRRGPARPCGRVTTRTVIGPCGRAGATSARAGCFFVFGLDFSRACRCCLLCTCDLIYIRVHRSVCAPRHACCVLLRPATDDSGPFAQCVPSICAKVLRHAFSLQEASSSAARTKNRPTFPSVARWRRHSTLRLARDDCVAANTEPLSPRRSTRRLASTASRDGAGILWHRIAGLG